MSIAVTTEYGISRPFARIVFAMYVKAGCAFASAFLTASTSLSSSIMLACPTMPFSTFRPTSSSVKLFRISDSGFERASATFARPSISRSRWNRCRLTKMARTAPCCGRSENSPMPSREMTSRMRPRTVRPGSSLRPCSDSVGIAEVSGDPNQDVVVGFCVKFRRKRIAQQELVPARRLD